jgi:hypothetical protein
MASVNTVSITSLMGKRLVFFISSSVCYIESMKFRHSTDIFYHIIHIFIRHLQIPHNSIMKIPLKLWLILLLPINILAQDSSQSNKSPNKIWTFNAEVDANFQKYTFFTSSVFTADKKRLHMEARYNYTAVNTIAVWGGYNFNSKKKLQIKATPMLGLIFGDLKGISPGLELSLTYKRWQFDLTTEWLFSFDKLKDNDIFYWAQTNYALTHWWQIGITSQLSRLYQSTLTVLTGPVTNFIYKNATLSFTTYNIFSRSTYFISSVFISF